MIPEWIMSLIKEIAPGAEQLYLSAFNEKTCLTDATNLIRDLKSQNQRRRDALETIAKQLKSCEWEEYGDIEYAYDEIIHIAREALKE